MLNYLALEILRIALRPIAVVTFRYVHSAAHLSIFPQFKIVLICNLQSPEFFRVSISPEINIAHVFSRKNLSGLESQIAWILISSAS
jgi:hypothetical protein